MIYTRRFNDKAATLDYTGTNRELKLDIMLLIKNMYDNKDIEEDDLIEIIFLLFRQLEEVYKILSVDLLIDDIKGGNLWQEPEGLSK